MSKEEQKMMIKRNRDGDLGFEVLSKQAIASVYEEMITLLPTWGLVGVRYYSI